MCGRPVGARRTHRTALQRRRANVRAVRRSRGRTLGRQMEQSLLPASRPARRMTHGTADPAIESLAVDVFTVPTDTPESDGTLAWHDTTIAVVRARPGGLTGLGYSYTAAAAGQLIADVLRPVVIGRSPFEIGACAT